MKIVKVSQLVAGVERENIREAVAEMFEKAIESGAFTPDEEVPFAGTINVAPMFTVVSKVSGAEFNWTFFDKTIRTAVRFLDNALDTHSHLIKEDGPSRIITIDITGQNLLADILGLQEDKHHELIAEIATYSRRVAAEASIVLAIEKEKFDGFDFERYSESILYNALPDDLKAMVRHFGIRNEVIDIMMTPDEVMV